ncbi:MAG: hypothetical protein JW819_06720 [Candidatus Krumholzibacteriota bacterium]|nr:hypothetical protein [Candidatus Krumholzibacteriota bacterium]
MADGTVSNNGARGVARLHSLPAWRIMRRLAVIGVGILCVSCSPEAGSPDDDMAIRHDTLDFDMNGVPIIAEHRTQENGDGREVAVPAIRYREDWYPLPGVALAQTDDVGRDELSCRPAASGMGFKGQRLGVPKTKGFALLTASEGARVEHLEAECLSPLEAFVIRRLHDLPDLVEHAADSIWVDYWRIGGTNPAELLRVRAKLLSTNMSRAGGRLDPEEDKVPIGPVLVAFDGLLRAGLPSACNSNPGVVGRRGHDASWPAPAWWSGYPADFHLHYQSEEDERKSDEHREADVYHAWNDSSKIYYRVFMRREPVRRPG